MNDLSETSTTPAASPEAPQYQFSRKIFCLSQPGSPETESIRSLQTHLMAGHVRDGRRALAICSASPGVGCTTVSVNLAVTFAQAGINTLLIDANLHDPAVADYIRPSQPAAGLREMLTSQSNLATDEVRRDVLPNLSVLYSGARGRNGSELIARREFKQVIDDCMRDFEFTIVDTPAAGGTADARRVAMSVRYGLIVARRNMSLVSQTREFVEELTADRVRLVGTFLTDF